LNFRGRVHEVFAKFWEGGHIGVGKIGTPILVLFHLTHVWVAHHSGARGSGKNQGQSQVIL